jgi:hypothetical protein
MAITREEYQRAGWVIGPDGVVQIRKAANATNILGGTGAAGETDLSNRSAGEPAKPKRAVRHGAVGAVQAQGGVGRRFFIRVRDYRKRLLDEDNLVAKFHIDLLRYSSVIPSDAPGTAKIEVTQEKVGPKEPELTVLEVYEL